MHTRQIRQEPALHGSRLGQTSVSSSCPESAPDESDLLCHQQQLGSLSDLLRIRLRPPTTRVRQQS